MQIWGEWEWVENLYLFYHKSPLGVHTKRIKQEKQQYFSICLKVIVFVFFVGVVITVMHLAKTNELGFSLSTITFLPIY